MGKNHHVRLNKGKHNLMYSDIMSNLNVIQCYASYGAITNALYKNDNKYFQLQKKIWEDRTLS